MKVPSVECPLFHLKLYHISTKLFHFVVVDVEDRSHASFVLFLLIYEGCLLSPHTVPYFSKAIIFNFEVVDVEDCSRTFSPRL